MPAEAVFESRQSSARCLHALALESSAAPELICNSYLADVSEKPTQLFGEEGQLLREPDLNAYHTYEDYYHYQLEGAYELVKGWLRKMAAPLDAHQAAAGEVYFQLRAQLDAKACVVRQAPYDVRLFAGQAKLQHTVVQPDICIICDRSKIDLRGCNGAPDLIVEVISKKTATYDRTTKLTLYEQAGVPEYWIIDYMLRRCERRQLNRDGRYPLPDLFGAGDVVESLTLDGLSVDVDAVFAALLT